MLSQAFKSAERRIIEAQVLQELDLDRSALDKLSRNIKEACWKGGVPAMRKAGLSQARLQRLREEQPSRHADSLQGSSQLQQQQQQLPIDAPGEAAADDSREGGSATSSSSEGTSSSTSSTGSSDSQAEYGPYFKRQYLFIAATMPALTKGDVGIELQKRFPGALWVSGDMLHQVGGFAGTSSAWCVGVGAPLQQHMATVHTSTWPRRQIRGNHSAQLQLRTALASRFIVLPFADSVPWACFAGFEGLAFKATCLDSLAA